MVGTIGGVSGPPAELVFQELAAFVYTDAAHCDDCSRVELPARGVAADIEPPTFDVSKTLDGGIVATNAFRACCDGVPGIEFVPLIGLDDHWLIEVAQTVRIDPFASHVREGPECSSCGQPRYVMRSGPIRLDEDEVVSPGFNRTDAMFGDTADFGVRQPVRLRSNILVDRETARRLKSAALLGIHLITQP